MLSPWIYSQGRLQHYDSFPVGNAKYVRGKNPPGTSSHLTTASVTMIASGSGGLVWGESRHYSQPLPKLVSFALGLGVHTRVTGLVHWTHYGSPEWGPLRAALASLGRRVERQNLGAHPYRGGQPSGFAREAGLPVLTWKIPDTLGHVGHLGPADSDPGS